MLLLVIGILLLPPAIALTTSDLAIINSPETYAKNDSMPSRVTRGIVLTRDGGDETPIKNLAVKVYEKEGEYQVVHINYAILYHSGDFVIAHRRVAAEEFDKLWYNLKRERVMYLNDAEHPLDDKPVSYKVHVRELKQNNKFKVQDPNSQDDERYQNVIDTLEIFWQGQLDIE